jgi:crossover junction endodeoxyribonuclease RusA
MIVVAIPFPPSVNALYRTFRGRVIMSKVGRDWYKANLPMLQRQAPKKPIKGRIDIKLEVSPPDNRRRDIDNLAKVSLDCLTKAGVWEDDSQIDRLTIHRGVPDQSAPSIICHISEIE